MSDKPKRIGAGDSKAAAKYLYETGLLFEINRKVLHPLGLALSVECDDETDEVKGFAYLWDSTADPEGIRFSPESFMEGFEKLKKYLLAIDVENVLNQRRAALGYIVQDTPEATCHTCIRAGLTENDAVCKDCSQCVGSTSKVNRWEPGDD